MKVVLAHEVMHSHDFDPRIQTTFDMSHHLSQFGDYNSRLPIAYDQVSQYDDDPLYASKKTSHILVGSIYSAKPDRYSDESAL